MRLLSLLAIILAPLGLLQAEVCYEPYGTLLQKYVKTDGVAYEAWNQDGDDVAALDKVLEKWAKVNVAELSREEQKAFYINLYNAAMLQAVFDNYPLKSVKNIGLIPFSIFKKDFIQHGERELSLDDVEKGILLKEYFDPRIHFVVNCASESCPPLLDEPFTAEKLEAQLDGQTRAFANSRRAARVDHSKKRTAYSELFNWYNKDFDGVNPAEYLNRYRDEALPLDYKIDWIRYDWALNKSE